MATTKDITMKRYNGTDYDELYPLTTSNKSIETNNNVRSVLQDTVSLLTAPTINEVLKGFATSTTYMTTVKQGMGENGIKMPISGTITYSNSATASSSGYYVVSFTATGVKSGDVAYVTPTLTSNSLFDIEAMNEEWDNIAYWECGTNIITFYALAQSTISLTLTWEVFQ